MKKLLTFVILVLCFTVNTLAGDLPEAVLTLWDTDVFIGEIIEIKDGRITIAVSHALFENFDISEITVDKFQYMSNDAKYKTPEKGDFVAAAVEFNGGGWDIVFRREGVGLTAKSDSLDPKTLTLYTGGNAFTERMNEYINNGTYSYEKRKEIRESTEGTDNDDSTGKESEEPQALDIIERQASEELDAEQIKIMRETEIVVPPPAGSSSKNTAKWSKTSQARYASMIIISLVVGYAFAKGYARKQDK